MQDLAIALAGRLFALSHGRRITDVEAKALADLVTGGNTATFDEAALRLDKMCKDARKEP